MFITPTIFYSWVKYHSRLCLSLLYSSILLCAIHACLPIEELVPTCFPNETCPLGSICIAGECQKPPVRTLTLNMKCLSDTQCRTGLENYVDLSSSENESMTSSVNLSQACLLLLQNQHIQMLSIDLEQTEVQASLFEAQTQAFLLLLNQDYSCPVFETFPKKDLSDLCQSEQGCHFYLRASPLIINKKEQVINKKEQADISFTYQDGQCIHSTWSTTAPMEVCDQGDNDCDGFIDEGVSCVP
jgi:hypothetical protein